MNELTWGVIKDFIRSAENINSLYDYNEIEGFIIEEGYDADDIDEILVDNWKGLIILKDNTEVELSYLGIDCFENKDHRWFYKIENNNYICLECLQHYKIRNDIYKEVSKKFKNKDFYEPCALPSGWSNQDVYNYYTREIKKNINENY